MKEEGFTLSISILLLLHGAALADNDLYDAIKEVYRRQYDYYHPKYQDGFTSNDYSQYNPTSSEDLMYLDEDNEPESGKYWKSW